MICLTETGRSCYFTRRHFHPWLQCVRNRINNSFFTDVDSQCKTNIPVIAVYNKHSFSGLEWMIFLFLFLVLAFSCNCTSLSKHRIVWVSPPLYCSVSFLSTQIKRPCMIFLSGCDWIYSRKSHLIKYHTFVQIAVWNLCSIVIPLQTNKKKNDSCFHNSELSDLLDSADVILDNLSHG